MSEVLRVPPAMRLSRADVAWRAAQDLRDGTYVNLGVGLPSLVADRVPAGREVIFQSENGALGVGPAPREGEGDPELINASTQQVTLRPGGAFFDCATSFVMLRGGHLDLAILGAFQVSEHGDLASWNMDTKDVPPAVGGAMDIAVGAKAIWVLMEHCTKEGEPRLVASCRFPVTARGVVTRVYTDLAVLDVVRSGLLVRESVAWLTREQLRAKTGATLSFAEDWRPLAVRPAAEEASCP